MNKLIIVSVLALTMAACGASVVPSGPPSIYIDNTCTFQQQTWIINATNGTPVDQTGEYRQNGRSYWGAQYIFTCLPLNNCNDLVVDPPRSSLDWIVLAPNCDVTEQAFEARVRGYVAALETTP